MRHLGACGSKLSPPVSYTHLKLPRRVVLAQISAQDLPGFPGDGHLRAGEVAERRTGLHRLTLHFAELPCGEQLDQPQFMGIPQLPQFIQRRLNGGRSRRCV